jgi:hypothetical protein
MAGVHLDDSPRRKGFPLSWTSLAHAPVFAPISGFGAGPREATAARRQSGLDHVGLWIGHRDSCWRGTPNGGIRFHLPSQRFAEAQRLSRCFPPASPPARRFEPWVILRLKTLIILEMLVLPERIELSTSPLPRECSTTELRQRARAPGCCEGRAAARAKRLLP